MSKEFTCFVLRIIQSDHAGSYDIIDHNNKIIGYSEGYTIKRRSILANYEKAGITHEIIKRDKGIYLIQSNNELLAILKIHTFHKKLELKCIDENLYFFHSTKLGKVYRIENLNSLGIVSCDNWHMSNIGLALTSPTNHKVILSSLMAVAYDVRLGASRYIN